MRCINEDDKFLLLSNDDHGHRIMIESASTLADALEAARADVCENVAEIFIAQVTHKVTFQPSAKETELRKLEDV